VLGEPVEAAGEVALEAAVDVAGGLAVADAAVDVVARRAMSRTALERDRVEGAVELAIASAVESVPDRLSNRILARTLFGSDLYVVENARVEERRRSVRIRAVLGEEIFHTIAVDNARAFLA
jgi:hypothetical protein